MTKYATLPLKEFLWIFRCPVAIIPFVYVTWKVKVCCVIRIVLITASSFSISRRRLVETLRSAGNDRTNAMLNRWNLASLCKFSAHRYHTVLEKVKASSPNALDSSQWAPPTLCEIFWSPCVGILPGRLSKAEVLSRSLSKAEVLSRKFCIHASQCYDRKQKSWRGMLTYARNSRVVTTESPFFK